MASKHLCILILNYLSASLPIGLLGPCFFGEYSRFLLILYHPMYFLHSRPLFFLFPLPSMSLPPLFLHKPKAYLPSKLRSNVFSFVQIF